MRTRDFLQIGCGLPRSEGWRNPVGSVGSMVTGEGGRGKGLQPKGGWGVRVGKWRRERGGGSRLSGARSPSLTPDYRPPTPVLLRLCLWNGGWLLACGGLGWLLLIFVGVVGDFLAVVEDADVGAELVVVGVLHGF